MFFWNFIEFRDFKDFVDFMGFKDFTNFSLQRLLAAPLQTFTPEK